MSPIRPLTLVIVCLLAPAVADAAGGSVHLYLQPLPAEAARLAFTVGSVSAVGADGVEYPLRLSLASVSAREADRQRLLASGQLPAGTYAGFSIVLKQATLKQDQGSAALAVPSAPLRVDAVHTVRNQQATVYWLTLKYDESLSGGMAFSPVFSVITAPRPISDHAAFVSSSASNIITVIDTHLMQAAAVIETCAGPAGLALDPLHRRLFVACPGDEEIRSIDAATGDLIQRTRTSPGDRPEELALTPDGRTLLSVNAGSSSISFFDAASLTRQDRIPVGSGPASVLVEPGGARAFVFNTLSSSVSVIDVAGRRIAATLSTDPSPLRGRFNARGDRMYVIHDRSAYMTVVDPGQLTLVTRARLRSGVNAIALDRARGLVCLGGVNETAVEFYDPNALMPLFTMRTRAGVLRMTTDVVNNRLYMVSPETRSVIVGRLADRKVESEIDVGAGPYWVAVMGEK